MKTLGVLALLVISVALTGSYLVAVIAHAISDKLDRIPV